MNSETILQQLGIHTDAGRGDLSVHSPIDGEPLGYVRSSTSADVEECVETARAAFRTWRLVPPPRRGELVRRFGEQLRSHKQLLGTLVTLETGKILEEGLGEVQEMIDTCDFAVGLSRQLYGLVMACERPGHCMSELWHPMGPVGVISAFNFPAAVWCWNSALALVCGNSVVWKPSEKTPLTALACQRLLASVAGGMDDVPEGISQLLIGGKSLAEKLVDDVRVPVISATGSCDMGRSVGPAVAARFGRSILELGGNNAVVVTPSADLNLALPAIVFGATGTAGQRCTTTRRLLVHERVHATLLERLRSIYAELRIGNPLETDTLVGPLIDGTAYQRMQVAMDAARAAGGQISGGERELQDRYANAWYVRPALADMPGNTRCQQEEIFAPLLYIYRYRDLEEAIAYHNDVPQGLSSSIFTTDLREAELFRSAAGSDCGIVNINIGTSGAEIGGAFGGEKATGGGRESGSDAWKGYMRRVTSTLNYSSELPLAQGIRFQVAAAPVSRSR